MGRKALEPLGERVGQRRSVFAQRRPSSFVCRAKFARQHQQPGPAIGPLETAGVRPRQIGELARDVVWRECAVEQRADRVGLGQVGEAAVEPRQQPVAVHAGMPVEAAEEDRMQRARRPTRRPGRSTHGSSLLGYSRVTWPSAMRAKREARSASSVRVESLSSETPGNTSGAYWRAKAGGGRRLRLDHRVAVGQFQQRRRHDVEIAPPSGVISVPQKPASMPIAPMIAGSPPNLCTISGSADRGRHHRKGGEGVAHDDGEQRHAEAIGGDRCETAVERNDLRRHVADRVDPRPPARRWRPVPPATAAVSPPSRPNRSGAALPAAAPTAAAQPEHRRRKRCEHAEAQRNQRHLRAVEQRHAGDCCTFERERSGQRDDRNEKCGNKQRIAAAFGARASLLPKMSSRAFRARAI